MIGSNREGEIAILKYITHLIKRKTGLVPVFYTTTKQQ